MGECGCSGCDDRYLLPGPGKSFYVITLSGGCVGCDYPSGICIEQIEPNDVLYGEYRRGDFTRGRLKLEQWPDSKGVAITTGMRRHEFVKALKDHLIGVDSRELGDGKIDESGAAVILEDMFDDAQTRPTLVPPSAD